MSNRRVASVVDLFKMIFHNDKTAQGIQLGRDKIAYTIVDNIVPFVKKYLDEEVSMSPVFVAAFDEC